MTLSIVSMSCSWCDHLNKVEHLYCSQCGHCAQVPRALCTCFRCQPPIKPGDVYIIKAGRNGVELGEEALTVKRVFPVGVCEVEFAEGDTATVAINWLLSNFRALEATDERPMV